MEEISDMSTQVKTEQDLHVTLAPPSWNADSDNSLIVLVLVGLIASGVSSYIISRLYPSYKGVSVQEKCVSQFIVHYRLINISKQVHLCSSFRRIYTRVPPL